MKKIYIILILFFSCSEINQISKPDNLIDENKMSKILYDIAIMKSITSPLQKEYSNLERKL